MLMMMMMMMMMMIDVLVWEKQLKIVVDLPVLEDQLEMKHAHSA